MAGTKVLQNCDPWPARAALLAARAQDHGQAKLHVGPHETKPVILAITPT